MARHQGLLNDDLYDIDKEDRDGWLLRYTPSSALGSCRYKLADPDIDDTDYKRILEIFEVRHPLLLLQRRQRLHGYLQQGFQSMMTKSGYECRVMAFRRPSTMTCSLTTDHCPASALLSIATSCMEIYQDARVY